MTVNKKVKRSDFLSVLYIVFLTFSVCVLIFGETGLSSFKRLRMKTQALSDNLIVLQEIHDFLQSKIDSLSRDPEAIIIEARALGLYRKGEHAIFFGERHFPHFTPESGKFLIFLPRTFPNASLFRSISFVTGLFFLVYFLVRRSWHNAYRSQ